MQKNQTRIVIVGAGFGGLAALRAFSASSAKITLVDRNNYHIFLPLLYQVSAAELEPEEIAYPIRSIVRKLPNTFFIMSDVSKIDICRKTIQTSTQEIPYDFLVLGTGSRSHFFGIAGAEEFAFPLKTLEEGITLRNHILGCFEKANCEPSREKREKLLTFAIIGAGPTGIEFTGALAELIRGPLRKDYPLINFREVQVILIEAGENILGNLSSPLIQYALNRIKRLGVEIRLKTKVQKIQPEAVILADGKTIPTVTAVWTAGVCGDPLAKNSGIPTTRDGRVEVLPTLQLPDHPEVFIIGDMAFFKKADKPLPMIAPVAIQQGETAGKNILRLLAGKEPLPFQYRDQGSMVVIGRNSGVANIHGYNFTGFPAWILWIGVHLFKLIGFRNRFFVLINWGKDYIFFDRAVRLIVPLTKPKS